MNAYQAFTDEVSKELQFWNGIPASVNVVGECSVDKANAIATPSRQIFYGAYLYWSMVNKFSDFSPNAGVLAHEWGHQVQFRYMYQDPSQPTARQTELEADGFSGYYFYLERGMDSQQI